MVSLRSALHLFDCIKISRAVWARTISSALVKDLEALISKENVTTVEAVREQHSHDESYHTWVRPDVVVFAKTIEHVSKVAAFCNKNLIPLTAFGSGTGLEGGSVPVQNGVSINLSFMDEITRFHTEDFDVSAQPGVGRLALNHYLHDSGLWFPIDPGADASVCGMAATSASGTNAVRYGTMRENVLNLEVVLADGSIIHTAGKHRRPKKTSAGYNLTNLFVGSEGTLGIITEVTLRLHGIPETIMSAVCPFDSTEHAVRTCVDVLQMGIPIARLEYLDEVMMQASNKFSKMNYQEKPTLFLEFHGTELHVKNQVELVSELARDNGCLDFNWAQTTEERNKLWKARHECIYATLALRPNTKCCSTDVCVPISHLPEMIAYAKDLLSQTSITATIVGHVGDGNFHVFIAADTSSTKEINEIKHFHYQLAQRAQEKDGTCTGEHGIGLGKRHLLINELGQPALATMQTLKKALDPNGILNPGKIFLT